MNNQRDFLLEFTITQQCNFKCAYCYEENGVVDTLPIDRTESTQISLEDMIRVIDDFLVHPEVKKRASGRITVNFWGGEPSLRSDIIEDLLDHYSDNDNVSFFSYTNGSNINKYIELFKKHNTKREKFRFQISYDGLKTHEKKRKNTHFKSTTKLVRDAIFRCINEIKYWPNVKATIPMDCMTDLGDNYLDFVDLFMYARDVAKLDKAVLKGIRFYPTPDMVHLSGTNGLTDEEAEIIRVELEKIAEYEKLFFKMEGRYFFNWFTDVRAVCSAGLTYINIDTNGDIYNCHGCLYAGKDKHHHTISSIYDKNYVMAVMRNHDLFQKADILKVNPSKECEECDAPFCIRCNVAKYAISTKENYVDRWTDYSCDTRLCALFKIIGDVKKKFLEV